MVEFKYEYLPDIVFSRVEYVKINVKRKSLVATSSGSDVLVHGANFVDPKFFSATCIDKPMEIGTGGSMNF